MEPNTPKKEWSEEVREVIEALRAPSNWLQQPRGEQWKDVVNKYDRTPLQAAALLEEALSRDEALIASLEELKTPANQCTTGYPCEFENRGIDEAIALIKNRNN